jgi:2,4-dienoyl-CoA reductase-like NADH-dependent reductase (Old Yellow Enzyme family)
MNALFDKTIINQMELKNRFVRSATWEGLANLDGSPSTELEDLLLELAKGQLGLIITSHAFINKVGQARKRQLGIFNDKLVANYTKMIEKIHQEGSKIIIQISHAGCRAPIQLIKEKPLGPSFIKSQDCDQCKGMTKKEITQTIRDFQMAAVRAKKAGFDGIQIHAAHGYLLSQFLSPYFNHRIDEYGGSIENRSRMLLEIISSIRDKLGKDFAILTKINSDDYINGGFRPFEMLQVSKMLEEAGIDAIELSGGTGLAVSKYSYARKCKKENIYYYDSAKLFKKKIKIPLIIVGGIRSYDTARELIKNKLADYISLCRPLIREPYLIKNWKENITKIAKCISCNKCYTPIKEGKGIYCVQEKNYLKNMRYNG